MWADLAADFAEEEQRRRALPVIAFGLSIGGFLASLQRFDIRVEPEDFTDRPVLVVHRALDGCGHLPYEEPGVRRMAEAISRFVSTLAAEATPPAEQRPTRAF
jgi:hypothetical protein